jgi:hypothetical protein
VLLALVPDVPPEAEELEWVHRHGAMPPRHSLGLVAEVSIARALGLPVVLASKTPPERLHPAYLAPNWNVLSEDIAAAHAAIRMCRRG